MGLVNIDPEHKSTVFHRTLDHQPLFIKSALGNYLYTESGDKILDACGGAAVVSIGHGRERVINALTDQLRKVAYVHSGAFGNRPAEELADHITKSSGMARALFHTGGTEAMESAIKLARQYHIENGQPQRVNYIAREQSYHGNSVASLSLCRHTIRRKPYLPLFKADNFHSVSPCYAYRYKTEKESDAQYVERLAGELEAKILELGSDTVVAFFAETIVGATSGTTPAVPGYFQAMRTVCDKYGVLLVLDEIMCGMGRTGKMHAWQWEGIQPDIQTIGKGMGGGYAPISAVLISHKVVDVLSAGSGAFNNGYTYQSHAAGCASALEVLTVMDDENLVQQCHERGLLLQKSLFDSLGTNPHVGDIRGRGLFWSVELVKDKATKEMFPVDYRITDIIAAECMGRGLVIYPGMKGTVDGVQGDHLLIAPPYTITEEEVAFIASTLSDCINVTLKV